MQWFQRFMQKNGIVGMMMTIYAIMYLLVIVLTGILSSENLKLFYSAVFLPADVKTFVSAPWSLLTYWSVMPPLYLWVLIVDMALIYTYGNILNAMLGDRKTQGIIFLSILVNGILTITFVNLLPTIELTENVGLFGLHTVNATLISACIALVPNYKFRIIRYEVNLWIIGAIMLLIMTLSYQAILTSMGVSILVGTLVGFTWVKVLQSGTDLSSWLQFNLGFEAQKHRPIGINRERIRIVHTNQRNQKTPTKPTQTSSERLDELLDKINQVGYQRLNKKEKEELDRLSNN